MGTIAYRHEAIKRNGDLRKILRGMSFSEDTVRSIIIIAAIAIIIIIVSTLFPGQNFKQYTKCSSYCKL